MMIYEMNKKQLQDKIKELQAESKRFLESANNQIKWTKEQRARADKLEKELMVKNIEFEEMKRKYDLLGDSSSDLKAKFIGEYKWIEHETYLDDCGEEARQACERIVSWTMLKDIFKQMTQYVKDRDPKDYRP